MWMEKGRKGFLGLMGACESSSNPDARQRDKEINSQIEKDRRLNDSTVKLLLLGEWSFHTFCCKLQSPFLELLSFLIFTFRRRWKWQKHHSEAIKVSKNRLMGPNYPGLSMTTATRPVMQSRRRAWSIQMSSRQSTLLPKELRDYRLDGPTKSARYVLLSFASSRASRARNSNCTHSKAKHYVNINNVETLNDDY